LGSGNKSGYCSQHHRPGDRLTPRFCNDCHGRLRSDNQENLCIQCRIRRLENRSQRFCGAPECARKIRHDNESGLCAAHHHFINRRPSVWGTCAEPECNRRILLTTSKSGLCRAHKYPGNRPSIKPQVCKEKGCENMLRSDNTTGYCHLHTFKSYAVPPRLCSVEGCTNKLGANNKSGICGTHFNQIYAHDPEHREAAANRQAVYRERLKQRLAKADRVTAGRPEKPTETKAEMEVGRLLDELTPLFKKILPLYDRRDRSAMLRLHGVSQEHINAIARVPRTLKTRLRTIARHFFYHSRKHNPTIKKNGHEREKYTFDTIGRYDQQYLRLRGRVSSTAVT